MLKKLIYLFALLNILACSACKNEGENNTPSVTVRLNGEPERLNPLTTEEGNAVQVMSQIFLSLLDFDPQTLELAPVLAKSRPIITLLDTGIFKGGMSLTYQLRDEATWDDGKPVTAADYLFTLKTILNKKSGANNLRSTLDFVKDAVIDPQNPKIITLFSDKRQALAEVQTGTFPVLPEHIYDKEGVMKNYTVNSLLAMLKDTSIQADDRLTAFATAFQSPQFAREKSGVIGCGAYALDEWLPEQRIVLIKKTNWWGDKLAGQSKLFAATPPQLVFKIVKDQQASVTLMQNGELDVATKIPGKAFLDMQKDAKMAAQYNFATAPALSIGHVGLNCKSPKLNDKRVRRAVAHLFDNQAIIKNLMNGFAEPCIGPFVPQRSYYAKDLAAIAFNIDSAKALITAAGWKDSNGDGTADKNIGGKTTELTLRFLFAANNDVAKNIGLMIQEAGKKAGIGIVLEPLEAKVLLDNMKKRDFDMFVNNSAFSPSLDDPKEMWASSSNKPDGGNRFQFENKEADALIEQIRTETDDTKRNDLYRRFQKLIYDEQPAVFMFAPMERLAINKRLSAATYPKRPGYVLGEFKMK